MKNIILIVFVSLLSLNSFAQYREVQPHQDKEEESSGGFKKDHLFTGGGINLSLSNYNFGVGVNPVFGYSFNKWFDAGIGLGFTYVSARQVADDGFGGYYATGLKIHQTDIAPSVFARVYPLKFLFVQAQGEQNFISQKYIDGNNNNQDNQKIKYDATSLLLGVGYCGGRQGVGDFFYFFSISVDVLKNSKSPYVEVVNNTVNILPILKAGIQVPLFQGGKGKRDD